MKVLIVYYSTYGHVHKMAEAVAEGVGEIDGAEAILRRVPETLPEEVLEKMGAVDAQQSMSKVPICTVEELASADAFHITLLHHGFVIVGLPYTFQGQMRIDEITGGSPYGASTIAGGSGERMPSENELDAARFQGKHVATIASKLKE